MIPSLQNIHQKKQIWVITGIVLLYGIYIYSYMYKSIPKSTLPHLPEPSQLSQPTIARATDSSSTVFTPTQFFTADTLGVVRTMDINNMFIPPKTIIMWTGSQIPTGWKECNGQEGTPDLRGRFPLAYNSASTSIANTVGKLGGEATVSLQLDQIPRHNHPGGTTSEGGWGTGTKDRVAGTDSGANNSGSHSHTFTTLPAGGDQSHNNMPRYYVVKFLMKV
jgi:hypothetical protein